MSMVNLICAFAATRGRSCGLIGRVVTYPLAACVLLYIGMAGILPAAAAVAGSELIAVEMTALQPYSSWKVKMDTIPQELLKLKKRGECFAASDDTSEVYSRITNEDLLLAVIRSQSTDWMVFEYAVARALHVIGPTRLFAYFKQYYQEHPDEAHWNVPRYLRLLAQAQEKLVTVDSLFIRDKKMSKDARDEMFKAITTELQTGVPFAAVRLKYANLTRETVERVMEDGSVAHLPGPGTWVGNNGPAIISKTRHDDWPFRERWSIPEEHVEPLFNGTVGQILLLYDKAKEMTVLYRIKDVYTPEARADEGSSRNVVDRTSGLIPEAAKE